MGIRGWTLPHHRARLWSAMRWLIGLAGVALCIHLILAAGWRSVAAALQSHWLFLLALTVVYTLYHLLRTWTLQICIPHTARFGDLFGIRLAGESVAYIAIGSVLGDALKVVLGRGRIPVVESATGVFAEKLIYHLSGAAFIIGGLLAAILRFGVHPVFAIAIAVLSILFVTIVILMSSGAKPLARLFGHVAVRRTGLRDAILKTEEALFQFNREHPREFLAAFALDLLSYFYSVGEVFVIFRLLGVQPTLLELWYYQAVVKTLNAAMIVVPANLGIFEATNVFLSRQLAFGTEAGIVAALFIRIRATAWSFIGYAWFLRLLQQRRSVLTGPAQPRV